MTPSTEMSHRVVARNVERPAKRLVLLSGAFLAVQVASTDYGTGTSTSSAAVIWFMVGAVLLWFVYRRRSGTARAVAVVVAVVGAVLYAGSALDDPDAALLVVAYAGQAIPLLLGPVQRHVAPAVTADS